jgi:glycosyltransferase involved in cell wall biosynthesis
VVRADAVVAVTSSVAEFVRTTVGEPASGIHVVPYGVVPPTIPPTSSPRAAGGVPTLLCVARMEPQKDHETLLAAFRRILVDRPARLVLLGRGARETHVRALTRGLPAGSVEFPAFAADPTPHYDAADVVVLASRWEGLGLALVEAAFRARPVVATRVGGIPEVVDDGETGLLVPPGDPRALADAVLRLLDDAALARHMGETAAQRVRARFDLDVCVDAHERIWRQMAGARA